MREYFLSDTPPEERADRRYEMIIRLTREHFEFIEEVCGRQGMSPTALIRVILADYLDRVRRQKGYEDGVNWDRITQTRPLLEEKEP